MICQKVVCRSCGQCRRGQIYSYRYLGWNNAKEIEVPLLSDYVLRKMTQSLCPWARSASKNPTLEGWASSPVLFNVRILSVKK